jgi:hypothetical protein
VELSDIALANQLAHEVLGRSLDELPPQTRRVLGMIESHVDEQMKLHLIARADVRFTRRQLRARCGISDAAIRVHLERLIAMEYLRPAVGRNGQRFEYELLFDGDLERATPQMTGLIDVEALRGTTPSTMPTSQGETCDLAWRLQAARTDVVPTSLSADEGTKVYEKQLGSVIEPMSDETARHRADLVNGRSHSAALPSRAPLSSSLAAKAAASGA